ncbi:hypothetical protein BKA64DRAFT_149371 [Cadophora sp. MPI-SDFR-AT-0126]|nr:hypothetical protein BKA64DRAFT_149371 [Leotiomycetes sp. MPI-SDFR-AT-0126]
MMDQEDRPTASCKRNQPIVPVERPEGSSASHLDSDSLPSNALIQIPESQPPDSVRETLHRNACLTGSEHNPRLPLICLENVRARLDHLITKNLSITAKLTKFRESILRDLFSHFRIRHVAAGHLSRADTDEETRKLCIDALKIKKYFILESQNDLESVDEALAGHATFLNFSRAARHEVLTNIQLLEDNASARCDYVGGRFPIDFPRMTALARLTAGEDYESVPSALPKPLLVLQEPADTTGGRFTCFLRLPAEVRAIIWKFSLPGQRILTHSSRHNTNLALLSTCIESRRIVKSVCTRILSPTYKTTATNMEFIWIDPDNDIIVRDLSTPDSDKPSKNLFDRTTAYFNAGCFRLFTGLAKVKHLAVAFDVLRQNGGSFFVALEACTPELETLTMIPSTQIDGSPLKRFNAAVNDNVRLIELDSNVLDYVYFRQSCIEDRIIKQKAQRGVTTIATALNHSQQYKSLFPSFVACSKGVWSPRISVALVTTWNVICEGWQTRHLDRDFYNAKYVGEDGKMYHGFVESGMMCSADGELLSRYDGMARFFEEV